MLVLLGILSVWSVLYELADTAARGISGSILFAGTAPDIAAALAGTALLARARRGERSWALIGLGALCWSAGDVYWSLTLASSKSPPVPSWADAGYLLFCPLTALGVLTLVKGRVRNAPRTLIADAAAAALALGAIGAAVVFEPVLAGAHGGALAVATNLAYPLVDILLLALLAGATALDNWRLDRTRILIAAGVVAFCAADTLYLIADAAGTYSLTSWFNPLWYSAPVLMAWAAWLPARSRTEPAHSEGDGSRGIVLPLLFACSALVMLILSGFTRVGIMAVALASLSLLVIMGRLMLTWRENTSLLAASRADALTDSLTGLGNRRALTAELARRLAHAPVSPFALTLFDLDGFKHYNDSFGHPAGDALLSRLGEGLAEHLDGRGVAYRMGGDEFCAIFDSGEDPWDAAQAAAGALSATGEGFSVGCSFGSVSLPLEASRPESALQIADQRMYGMKQVGRASASRQSSDVLLRALAERSPYLGSHLHDVAALARMTAVRLSLPPEEVDRVIQAAELHDVGKVAIPDAILDKQGPLTEAEWQFIRRHTVIGERIICAAPALRQVASIVRSSHERFDGRGYPDRLAGDEIPLAARIVAVCDAFDAMTTDRAYRDALPDKLALEELRRCSGSQFDPRVVEHFRQALPDAATRRPAKQLGAPARVAHASRRTA